MDENLFKLDEARLDLEIQHRSHQVAGEAIRDLKEDHRLGIPIKILALDEKKLETDVRAPDGDN